MTVRTSIYLPYDLKRDIERVPRERKCSEAEVIRTAVAGDVSRGANVKHPLPAFPLWEGEPDFSARTEEFLKGFDEKCRADR